MRFADCIRGTLTLADGAWGTQLTTAGGRITECLDLWNLTHPDRVRQVADSYVRAGSRIILTNTFRSNPMSLAQYGLQNQCAAINRAGVRLSRQAAGDSVMVFASIGPIGQPPSEGELMLTSLQRAFSEQAQALAAETPDAILIETMTSLEEARIAAEAALLTGLPVLVSFIFVVEKNKHRTPLGSTPQQVATALATDGIHAIGTNCCDLQESISICRQFADASPLPIWVKPSAGLPKFFDALPAYSTTPDEFGASAEEFRKAGATFLGGCCGTTPDFIRALAAQPALRRSAARDF